MAKRKKPVPSKRKKVKKQNRIAGFFKSQQTHLVFGVFIFTASIFLLISFYSFLMHWREDQSILNNFPDKSFGAKNLLGKLGANVSDFFVYDGFGLATFLFPILLFFTGLYIILNIPVRQLFKSWINVILSMIWLSIGLAYLKPEFPLLGGKVGFEINEFMQIYIGSVGVLLFLMITFLVFIISKFKITPAKIKSWIPKVKPKVRKEVSFDDDVTEDGFILNTAIEGAEDEIELELDSFETITTLTKDEESVKEQPFISDLEKASKADVVLKEEEELEIEVEGPVFEEHTIKNLSNTLVQDFGEFDPKLELSNYKFPELNLLKDYSNENIQHQQD